jgi:hypothetical protein
MPNALDASEPQHVALAVQKLGLHHAVIPSVDRDDLADGGEDHFAKTIRGIRASCPTTIIEILTPDFLRKDGASEQVVAAKPDVFNNLETVPSRYLTVHPPRAIYIRSDCCSGSRKWTRPARAGSGRPHPRDRRSRAEAPRAKPREDLTMTKTARPPAPAPVSSRFARAPLSKWSGSLAQTRRRRSASPKASALRSWTATASPQSRRCEAR